jgi:hypothetical protein
VHNRTEEDLAQLKKKWEWAPPNVDRLHVKVRGRIQTIDGRYWRQKDIELQVLVD